MVTQTRQQRRDNLSSEHYWFKRTYRQWKIRLLRHKLAYKEYCAHVAKRQWLNKLNSFQERIRAEREYVDFATVLCTSPQLLRRRTPNNYIRSLSPDRRGPGSPPGQ